ncbi:hypothetical protein DL770_009757 [Monosporascus sp. CRB-9-2]|nr:hypothetical protein DL770_009757 [Monosporascus sp. CRB-9-2]
MAGNLTYFSKLISHSISLPFRIFGYQLSAGFWFLWTKDSVDPPSQIKKNCRPTQYIYDPLPPGYIRVLELHPGSGDEPLHGTLHSVSLDCFSEYEALSYVWGKAWENPNTIDLGDGSCLPLGANLTDALRHIRHKRHQKTLWIDAVCINQNDMSERTHQVQLMVEIYGRCKSVIVWLGLPTAHSQLGMEIMSYLAGEVPFDARAPWNPGANPMVRAALRDILERPYFERLWVVQEAALAQRITMQVGNLLLEWSGGAPTRWFLTRIKLAELSPSWEQSELNGVDCRPIRELLEQNLATKARRNGTVEIPSLLDIVHSIRHRRVTSRHDQIYGAMGLVTPAQVAGFVPDYTMTWEETYRRFYDFIKEQVLREPGITLEDVRREGLGGGSLQA